MYVSPHQCSAICVFGWHYFYPLFVRLSHEHVFDPPSALDFCASVSVLRPVIYLKLVVFLAVCAHMYASNHVSVAFSGVFSRSAVFIVPGGFLRSLHSIHQYVFSFVHDSFICQFLLVASAHVSHRLA